MEIKDKIKCEFEAIGNSGLVLMSLQAESYFETAMESAAFLSGKNQKGVYVTSSRPYLYLSKEMQRRGINQDNIFFIDCISAMAGERGGGACTYVENPAAIEEISMHIRSLLDRIESGEKFLILDSLSTLLIYNSKNSVKEFAMFLINKLRLEGVNGVFLIIEKEAPEDIKQILIAMCDKVVYV